MESSEGKQATEERLAHLREFPGLSVIEVAELFEHIIYLNGEVDGLKLSESKLISQCRFLEQEQSSIRQAFRVEFDTAIAEDEDVIDLVEKFIAHHKEKEQQLIAANSKSEELERSVASWKTEAERLCRNELYLRGLIERIAKPFGAAAMTSDDGSVQQSIICLKVPELVEKERDEQHARVASLQQQVTYDEECIPRLQQECYQMEWECERLELQKAELEKERSSAAGVLMVDIDEMLPGSTMSKVVASFGLLRSQRDEQKTRAEKAEKELAVEKMNQPFYKEISNGFEEALGKHPIYSNGCWIERAKHLRQERDTLITQKAELISQFTTLAVLVDRELISKDHSVFPDKQKVIDLITEAKKLNLEAIL